MWIYLWMFCQLPCRTNPAMHHFVTEMCMCAHMHISVTKWCIVGYFSDALWDLWDGSWCKLPTFPLQQWLILISVLGTLHIDVRPTVRCTSSVWRDWPGALLSPQPEAWSAGVRELWGGVGRAQTEQRRTTATLSPQQPGLWRETDATIYCPEESSEWVQRACMLFVYGGRGWFIKVLRLNNDNHVSFYIKALIYYDTVMATQKSSRNPL